MTSVNYGDDYDYGKNGKDKADKGKDDNFQSGGNKTINIVTLIYF